MMNEIRNKRDYRLGYEFLGLLKEMEKSCGNPEIFRDMIETQKRELRAYAHKSSAINVGMGFEVERRVVKDDGIDGYIELLSIPTVFSTLEDDDYGNPGAETFFKDFLEIHASPSAYDCTGQAFTSWYKLFQRRGQFFCYHRVAFDV